MNFENFGIGTIAYADFFLYGPQRKNINPNRFQTETLPSESSR